MKRGMAKVGVVLLNLGGPERIQDVGPFLYNLLISIICPKFHRNEEITFRISKSLYQFRDLNQDRFPWSYVWERIL